ncbi:Imm49 family immunity protein [Streptomyces sp. NPDC056387]|uniref:Imm49 family immunity protein n=1 Tax=Streptomyces sp. NPDC056387 TaxID=3345803 RepID=UPI0035E31E49
MSAVDLSASERARVVDAEEMVKLCYPPIMMLYHYLRSEESGFTEAWADAFRQHSEYWIADEDRTQRARMALGQLAITSLAKSNGIPVEVEANSPRPSSTTPDAANSKRDPSLPPFQPSRGGQPLGLPQGSTSGIDTRVSVQLARGSGGMAGISGSAPYVVSQCQHEQTDGETCRYVTYCVTRPSRRCLVPSGWRRCAPRGCTSSVLMSPGSSSLRRRRGR